MPIRRLDPGFYLFGTRKIFAKVMNMKLVVRVGGGYMSFAEFIETYAHVELNKINELKSQGNWDLELYIKQMLDGTHANNNRGSSAAPTGGRMSQGRRSINN